jgi:hypothetical protein
VSGLHFRRVGIRRMLGITDGFELKGLGRGVNLVYGPNASGKTTTARAVEALLWPRVADRETTALEGVAELAGDRWSIRVDTGLVQYQQNGAAAGSLPTAPVENRDRYRLWLPDLLRAEDADFARKILIESSGGFDLEEAARNLERKRPSHRQRQQQLELRKAREKVREARAAQEALSTEGSELAAKEGRLSLGPELEEKLLLLRTAAEHAARRDEAGVARERLDALPPILARLRGDEAERLAELRLRMEEATAQRGAAEAARARAEREVRRLALPPALLEGDLLQRVQADLERLIEVDRGISEHERASATAAARLNEEAAPLRGVADPARLAALDLEGLDRLASAVEAAENARETRRVIAAELATLSDDPAEADVDRLRHGAFLLKQWLAAGRDDQGEARYLRAVAMTATIVLFGVSLGLFRAGSLFWGGGVLVCAGLAVLALQRAPRKLDSRPDGEREYLRLGLLDAPDLWDGLSVETCLARLEARIEQASRAERTEQRRQQLLARLKETEKREIPAAERLHAVAAEFGLDLETDGVRLIWLIERISRWQRARTERIAAERALVAACAEQRALLESANERLKILDAERITETRSLKGTVEKLREDLSTHQGAARSFKEAQEACERAEREVERLTEEVQRILDRIGITAREEHSLDDLCLRSADYREQARLFEIAEAQRLHLERALRELPGFEDSLLLAPASALVHRAAEAEREVAELRALGEEVGSLRARIAAATNGHTLEDALAEEANRREALLDLRGRELRAAVGALLVEYVERETRSEHLPEVFHRANQLFNRITRGAYELRVDAGDPPSFRAYDTRLDRGFALDELSSGTRVQLLFAVRIAFVECLEAGVALPLLMDETLANSDDERASAIMDAVIQLASDGRQIFYFTAQPDEVVKWTRALEERPDVEFARFDLGEIRRLDRRLDFDLIEIAEVGSSVPAPGGMDHREYGRRLRVPRIDIHAPTTSLHLWYLVEEMEVLHHVLANLDVTSWGELKSLMSTSGPVLLEASSYIRINAGAELAESAIDRIRIGRGRTVDRKALVASGAVSDRFIDEVDAVCRRHGGDARQLIDQLESRAVAKFQSRNIEALREFFEREGYLDSREPLGIEIIRRQIITEQSARSVAGPIALAEVDRLLARIAAGAGFPTQPRRTTASPQPQLWPEVPI